jgi:renalase
MSFVIVGAGVCGLWIARTIQDQRWGSVSVLEKSRGVGGRIATRRSDACKFDHGAQFYSLKSPMHRLHERWSQAGLTSSWFEADGNFRMNAPGGLTTLAKNLAEDLDVRLEQKAVRLESRKEGWTILTESGDSFDASTVVLTCPLPQSLELMQNSGIRFESALSDIRYSKALVGLIEGASSPKAIVGEKGYTEFSGDGIFSIADQKTKGVSPAPAWTVTMSPLFSDRHFEKEDSESLAAILTELRRLDPGFSFTRAQLKKWRYSHPFNALSSGFVSPEQGLMVAGDAFGGPSLVGAVKSAEAVISAIEKAALR